MVLFILYILLFFIIFKVMIRTMFKGIKNSELIYKSLIFTGVTFIFVFIILKLNKTRKYVHEKFENITTAEEETHEPVAANLIDSIEEDNLQQTVEEETVEEIPTNTSLDNNTLTNLSSNNNKEINTLIAEEQPDVEDSAEVISQPNLEEQTEKELVNLRITSDEEMKLEQQNKYNILPQDLWFKPISGAKDLFTGKACMVPPVINYSSLQYSDYS